MICYEFVQRIFQYCPYHYAQLVRCTAQLGFKMIGQAADTTYRKVWARIMNDILSDERLKILYDKAFHPWIFQIGM